MKEFENFIKAQRNFTKEEAESYKKFLDEFFKTDSERAVGLKNIVSLKNGGLQVGDFVEVNTSSSYYSDWQGQRCEIVGINKKNGKLDFTLNDGTMTYDGFEEYELTKVS